jgi:hypothetical protein
VRFATSSQESQGFSSAHRTRDATNSRPYPAGTPKRAAKLPWLLNSANYSGARRARGFAQHRMFLCSSRWMSFVMGHARRRCPTLCTAKHSNCAQGPPATRHTISSSISHLGSVTKFRPTTRAAVHGHRQHSSRRLHGRIHREIHCSCERRGQRHRQRHNKSSPLNHNAGASISRHCHASIGFIRLIALAMFLAVALMFEVSAVRQNCRNGTAHGTADGHLKTNTE